MRELTTTTTSQALVVQSVQTATPLRQSLDRLDTAARARLNTVGADVEVIVVDLADRLEARAVAAATGALHSHALAILGAAVVVGVIVGVWSDVRPRNSSSPGRKARH